MSTFKQISTLLVDWSAAFECTWWSMNGINVVLHGSHIGAPQYVLFDRASWKSSANHFQRIRSEIHVRFSCTSALMIKLFKMGIKCKKFSATRVCLMSTLYPFIFKWPINLLIYSTSWITAIWEEDILTKFYIVSQRLLNTLEPCASPSGLFGIPVKLLYITAYKCLV